MPAPDAAAYPTTPEADEHVDHFVDPTANGDSDLAVKPVAVTHERTDEDRSRFQSEVAALRTGAGNLKFSERILMIIGGIVAPLGLLFVFLGWVGASRTTNTFEQIPYMISGGLLGLGLVFLGAFFYFAHWITELVKEGRQQSRDLVAAVEALRHELKGALEAGNGRSPGSGEPWRLGQRDSRGALIAPPADPDTAWDAEPAQAIYATQRGSMAHKRDCVVVAGKDDVRVVDAAEGLKACKLCDPYTAP